MTQLNLHRAAQEARLYSAYLFDLDGTLIDTAPDIHAAGCQVFCVDYGYNRGIAADELGADRVIASFKDLL